MEHRVARLTLAVAVLAGAAAACGGGGGGGGGSASAVQTAPAGDQAVADRATLVITDFPQEWKSTPIPPETAAVASANERAFAQCMGRPPPDQDRTAISYSADFNSTETRRVSSSASVVRTVEVAQADFAAQRGNQALTCHKQEIESEFRRQLPNSAPQITVERLDMPVFGDESVAFRLDITSSADVGLVRTLIDLVFMRKARTEVAVNFIERNAPFPQDLQRSLLLRAVSRA